VFIAASSEGAPVSALVWWIIPFLALIGGIGYAYWITKWKSRYENRTHRSVGNFRRFQESFKAKNEISNRESSAESGVRVRTNDEKDLSDIDSDNSESERS